MGPTDANGFRQTQEEILPRIGGFDNPCARKISRVALIALARRRDNRHQTNLRRLARVPTFVLLQPNARGRAAFAAQRPPHSPIRVVGRVDALAHGAVSFGVRASYVCHDKLGLCARALCLRCARAQGKASLMGSFELVICFCHPRLYAIASVATAPEPPLLRA